MLDNETVVMVAHRYPLDELRHLGPVVPERAAVAAGEDVDARGEQGHLVGVAGGIRFRSRIRRAAGLAAGRRGSPTLSGAQRHGLPGSCDGDGGWQRPLNGHQTQWVDLRGCRWVAAVPDPGSFDVHVVVDSGPVPDSLPALMPGGKEAGTVAGGVRGRAGV